ncbi:MAG: aminopeptidase P family protein [Chloroflexi bacterium]|nr:aminopeptidase P family protein [Chloroflexota bacterium]
MVRMAPKLPFGGQSADWQERINYTRMRDYRSQRARQTMRKHGLAVMLEAGPTNIRYLTATKGYDNPQVRYVLFFAEGDPVMFEHDGWFHQMPDQAPWIKDWRIARAWLSGAPGPDASQEEAKVFAAEIVSELKNRGLLNEPLGLGGFDATARDALVAAGLKRFADTRPIMQEARCIKNQDEIACHKMVAAITDGVWFRVWEALRPGIPDTALCAVASAAGYEYGAETAVPGGWRTGPTAFDRGFHASSRILQVGDLVYGSLCGNTYMGYRSCSYRTFIISRKPNAKEKDWYKQLVERLDGVISEIKPGATTADAAKHFPPASSWGYKEEAEVLCSEIGHGIGLGPGYEIPIINRQWSLSHPQVFEEGMVIAIESREGETRVGGVRCEDVVVVTRDGAELIDHFPREEITEAPR